MIADSAAIRISQASARAIPAPAAGPGNAAIVGFRKATSAPVKVRWRMLNSVTRSSSEVTFSVPAPIPLTLPPAQNAAPAPVIRIAPTPGSSPHWRIMRRSAGVNSFDSEFRAAGRFSVIVATRSRISPSSSSVPVSSLSAFGCICPLLLTYRVFAWANVKAVWARSISFRLPIAGVASQAPLSWTSDGGGGWRNISGGSALVPRPFGDAFQVRMGIVANAHAVSDRPIQAGRKQDVRAAELIAHQELTAVRERDLDMTQLLAKILASLGYHLRCYSVDGAQSVGAVPTHHIQARRIQLGDDEKAPFQPRGIVALGLGDKGALGS